MIAVRPSTLTPPSPAPGALALGPASQLWRTRLASGNAVPLTGLLVTLPVFLQAPWVRHAPFSAALFTVVLLATGFALAHHDRPAVKEFGELLVGFSGSWLAGALFWGWARLHPLCHLPVEAFALPLAIGGLRSRWRLACGLYLGSLLGTAATDAVIAATGLMPLWPQALAAEANQATELLHQAATTVLQPAPLLLMSITAVALIQLSRRLWRLGPVARVAGAALATTLVVDGLFLAAALAAPELSGLI